MDSRLLLASILLAAACGTIVIAQWQIERYRMNARINMIRDTALAVEKTATQLKQTAAPAEQLAQIASTYDAADFVQLLTDMTPADTWISQLSINVPPAADVSFEMTGFTPPSLEYVKRLENKLAFRDIKVVETSADSASPGGRKIVIRAVRSAELKQVPADGSTKLAAVDQR